MLQDALVPAVRSAPWLVVAPGACIVVTLVAFALMGDGSFQYSVQGIYTGVQQKAHVIYVVFQNNEYGILKQFATLEQTPNVPGLDIPGLDIGALGRGYGAKTFETATLDDVKKAYLEALAFKGTSVIVVPITKELKPLFG